MTKTPGNGDQQLASTIGRKAAREDGFWLFARTPVDWGALDDIECMSRAIEFVGLTMQPRRGPIAPQAITPTSALPIRVLPD